MLTAYCRNQLTKKLAAYKIDGDFSSEDIAELSKGISDDLGKEFRKPILFSIPCGKGSLKEQPEPVEVA